MLDCFADGAGERVVPLSIVRAGNGGGIEPALPGGLGAFAEAVGFQARPGQALLAPGPDGALAAAALGVGSGEDPFAIGAGPFALPDAAYAIAADGAAPLGDPTLAALAWALGAYRFTRYRAAERAPARLVPPPGADLTRVERLARATALVRDLVNTPAGDMGPRALEDAASDVAEAIGANMRVIVGEMLRQHNYPMVHAVGRAAHEEPRLIELEWGDPAHPRLAIVGKGVTFDTGGLNLKPGDGMRLMKKDMGGAAHALALARLVIEAKLPVRLHVIVPMVENAIGPGAFRPGDILKSRSGKTVEIENTDAEGRLILADALTRAVEQKAELIVDFATLTGAARVALGPELAPFYTNDERLAADLTAAAVGIADPVWRMPLWDGYDRELDSPVADMKHISGGTFAGSVTAALFLRRFVAKTPWLHFDIYSWNATARPARPVGGDAHGLRATFGMLERRFVR